MLAGAAVAAPVEPNRRAQGYLPVRRRSITRRVRNSKGRMLMAEVLERVRKIVIEHLDADPEKVTEKASFIDDLGADSLDNVELVMAFEEEFDIEIPDDAAEHIQTVGDAVKFIEERTNG
jgi:acyl carrier protein